MIVAFLRVKPNTDGKRRATSFADLPKVIAAVLALASVAAHAGALQDASDAAQIGVLATYANGMMDPNHPVTFTDKKCRGGPAPYVNGAPQSGVVNWPQSGQHNDYSEPPRTGCWHLVAGGIQTVPDDGAYSQMYYVREIDITDYGRAHGM